MSRWKIVVGLAVAAVVTANAAAAAAAAPAAPAAEPTIAEIEAALAAAMRAAGMANAAPKVFAFGACFPVHEQPNTFVCLLPMAGEGRFDQVPLRRTGNGFEVVMDENGAPAWLDMACPPLAEAERFLRGARKDDRLKVTDFGADPFGELTDERGRFREETGPERLMCTYEFRSGSGQWTAVTYVWRKDGKYVFEPEHEVWDEEE